MARHGWAWRDIQMATFDQIQTEIQNMLDVPDDQLTDEQRAAMDAYLDELAGQESDKIDGFASFIRAETARAKYFKEEGQRLTNKAKTAEGRINYLKHKYLCTMQQHGLTKIQGNAYALSIRHTPTVEVTDPDRLDDLYVRIVPERREPDRRVIAEALKDGKDVPGCRIVMSDSLQIR